MSKRTIEIFTAGCPCCDEAVQTVRDTACPSCEVVVRDLREGCATDECRDKARDYGIRSVPTVVVNGVVADCCRAGGVSVEALRALGVGAAA